MLTNVEINRMVTEYKERRYETEHRDFLNSPRPESWLIEDYDMYDDVISNNKRVIYQDDYKNHSSWDEAVMLLKLNKISEEIAEDEEVIRRVAKSVIESWNQNLQQFYHNFRNGVYKHTGSPSIQPVVHRSAIEKESIPDQKKVMTIDEAFKLWIEDVRRPQDPTALSKKKAVSQSSIKAYQASRNTLIRFFPGTYNIYDLTSNDFEEMQDKLAQLPKHLLTKYQKFSIDEILEMDLTGVEKFNAKTINGRFENYRSLFKWLKAKRHIDYCPVDVDMFEEDEAEKLPFTNEDLQKIFHSDIESEYKDFMKLALYSGMRIGEIVNLEKRDIKTEAERRWITIRAGKTKNAVREIPVHPAIEDIIANRYKTKGKHLFFDGNKNSISKRFNRRINKVIPEVSKTFHSFRKNFAVALYDKYANHEVYIKVLMGHSIKDNEAFYTYAKGTLNREKTIEIVDCIEYETVS